MINPFRVGSYLIVDDLYGEEYFIEDTVVDWDRSIVPKGEEVGEHPTFRYRAVVYETIPDWISVPALLTAYSTAVSNTVGLTGVSANPSPFSRGN